MVEDAGIRIEYHSMIDQLFSALFRNHEGRIFVAGSVIYSLIGWIANFYPALIPVTDSTAWFCRFMPIPLFLFYVKTGAFRPSYQSSTFYTVAMLLVLTLPFVALPRFLK